jgi:hypothetical protein
MTDGEDHHERTSRRNFLEMTGAVGVALMVPARVACTKMETAAASSPLDIPQTRPADWDAVAFNRTRGNAVDALEPARSTTTSSIIAIAG